MPPRPRPASFSSGCAQTANPPSSARPRTVPRRPRVPNLADESHCCWVLSLPNSAQGITISVREVFDEEMREKVLWLALHGIPISAYVHLLKFPQPKNIRQRIMLTRLGQVIDHFIPELAQAAIVGEDADAVVQHLLDRSEQSQWGSSWMLKKALQKMTLSDTEQKRRVLDEKAHIKWLQINGTKLPNSPNTFRSPRKEETEAYRGMMADTQELTDIKKKFGYVEGDQKLEKDLMKKWLLKIRELGHMPTSLHVNEANLHGNIGDDSTGE
jgi:hypothetical protein